MAGTTVARDAESALRQLSWGKDRVLAARARCSLRILHGIRPEWAGEALWVDLIALLLPVDSKPTVD